MRTGSGLPFSAACERNKGPILEMLQSAFATCTRVLEIGSGTGQHAVHFAHHLPHLEWQPSELPDGLPALAERVRREGGPNLLPPIALDVTRDPWPVPPGTDAVFSANTLHIVHWDAVLHFFRGAGALLAGGGVLCAYGPFNYRGEFTSASNAAFDASLKTRDPGSGIRDFEAVDALARAQGFDLLEDRAMPANNRTLVWRKAGR